MEEFPNPFGMTPSLVRSFGSGFIAWWYGALNNIPVGWALCNGENGTPDLRDKFVYGAGTTPVGNTGGNATHEHDFTSDNHRHRFREDGIGVGSGATIDDDSTLETATGTTDPGITLPPYHALAYIMEL